MAHSTIAGRLSSIRLTENREIAGFSHRKINRGPLKSLPLQQARHRRGNDRPFNSPLGSDGNVFWRNPSAHTECMDERFCITVPLIHIIMGNDTEKRAGLMIDKRIGKRIKACRERLGLTQEALAEKTGLTTNYISTVERGASFPRCEKLIVLLNGLETSADAIFCDVLEYGTDYKAAALSGELATLSPEAQKRILQMVELMIRQERENG